MIKQISLSGLLVSYLLLIVIIFISHFEELRIEKDVIISFFRMSLQLFIAGFVLKYIFELNSSVVNVLIFCLMVYFASRIVIRRTGIKLNNVSLYLFISIFLSSLSILLVMLLGIVRLRSLDARYFIVLAGMIIGNSMNSTAIGIERFFSSYRSKKGAIEDLIGMGATLPEALSFVGKEALKASILPSLTSASGMGIVFLPGMMTGQILSGINPMQAVFYQISIVISITTTVCLSNYIMIKILVKRL